MAKKTTETGEFPVVIEEFLGEFGKSQIEIRHAFAKAMKETAGATHRTRKEWSELLELFHNKPTAIPWDQWMKNKGGQ